MSMGTRKSCGFIYHLITKCCLQNLFKAKIVLNCCILNIHSISFDVALAADHNYVTNLSNGDAILRSFTKQMTHITGVILIRIFYPRSLGVKSLSLVKNKRKFA